MQVVARKRPSSVAEGARACAARATTSPPAPSVAISRSRARYAPSPLFAERIAAGRSARTSGAGCGASGGGAKRSVYPLERDRAPELPSGVVGDRGAQRPSAQAVDEAPDGRARVRRERDARAPGGPAHLAQDARERQRRQRAERVDAVEGDGRVE